MNTFQDFFNLFNVKNFGGYTIRNNVFKFKLSNNKLSMSDFETRNEVIKINHLVIIISFLKI